MWQENNERCGRCGKPAAECSDPDKAWYPQRVVCYATMEREAANAKWEAIHHARPWHNGSWSSWGESRSDEHPYHRDHGMTIAVTAAEIRASDKFLSDENCGPVPIESAQATPAEEDTSGGDLTTTD